MKQENHSEKYGFLVYSPTKGRQRLRGCDPVPNWDIDIIILYYFVIISQVRLRLAIKSCIGIYREEILLRRQRIRDALINAD